MIRKDPIFKTLMLTRKGTMDKGSELPADPTRFAGEGLTFRAKLIGVLEVNAPRGDRLCQEALGELKMAVKAAGEHKQRIIVCIALDGLRLRDERTGDSLYHHAVHKISFIAQDMADPRAFGYIYGSPDQGHRFFGIKTDKHANLVVVAMRDLFQVVYDLKKQDVDKSKPNHGSTSRTNGSDCFSDSFESLDRVFTIGHHSVQTADLLDFQAEEKSTGSFDPFFSIESRDSPVSASRLTVTAVAPALPPPPIGGSAQTSIPNPGRSNFNFPEKFSETVGTNASSRFSPLMPPPTKTAKPKADASIISHYSTIRPRKKSAKDDVAKFSQPFKSPSQLFSDASEGKALGASFETQQSLSTLFHSKNQTSSCEKGTSPVPESSSGLKFCTPGANIDKFDCAPFIAKAKEPVDLFTELDPLNAGSTRPYLDKQYFFQDLKKPTNTNNISTEAPNSSSVLKEVEHNTGTHGGRRRSPSENQPVNYQPVADFQARLFDAHFSFEEPKKDPFDTNFVSSVSLGTAMSNHPEPAVTFPPSIVAFSSVGYENSKAISFSVEDRDESIPFHSDFSSLPLSKSSSPRPPVALLQTQASFGTPEIAKKNSSSSPGNFAHKNHSEMNPFPHIVEESCAVQAISKGANEPPAAKLLVKDAVSPLVTRRFSADSSSSEESADFQPFPSKEEHPWEHRNGHVGEHQTFFTSNTLTHSDDAIVRVSSPPQPPPRPPVLRPPPLPPKGQPPNIPQRSSSSAASEESGTPPLPVPMRKTKHVTSAKQAVQSTFKARGQVDDGEIKQRPAQSPKSKQPDINNISLLQLSNMSLSDLAATLKLPPVRIASMTLTELALRLNELNRIGNQEPIQQDSSTNLVKDEVSSRKEYYGLPKRSQRLSERSLEEPEDDEKDFEEEFEEDDDDEEEEEEEEQEPSENKLEDTEVCYKGGKKYEMLSDVHDHDHEEELDISNKKLIESGSTPPRPKCESATSTTSESDRYAALREIMEQDLASNRTSQAENANVTFDAEVKFANFESASDVFKESQLDKSDELHQPAQEQPTALGFEDDFSNLTVKIPQVELIGKKDSAQEFAMFTKPNATSTPEAFEPKAAVEDESAFDSDFNDVIHASQSLTSVKEDLFANNPLESECDELAKKFAAFEARFPLNPVVGFADSFVDMERSEPNILKKHAEAQSEDVASFDVDFDSAFQEKQEPLECVSVCQEPAVKKSTSVNIFRRVEDPFDDDFFHPSGSAGLPTAPKPTSSNTFATIVEDPFVWVQPFDDDAAFEDPSEAFS